MNNTEIKARLKAQMNSTLTRYRTKIQFTQYQEVKTFTYYGNKLRAINALRAQCGKVPVSVIKESYEDCGYPDGVHHITTGTIEQSYPN